MLKIFSFFYILLIFCSSLQAAEKMISKEEMLSRIDSGTISFETVWIFPTKDVSNGKVVNIPKETLLAKLLMKHPNLKEEYLYTHIRRTNEWEYMISYDVFKSKKCRFRAAQFSKSGDKFSYQTTPLMIDGEEIPMKYCEKLYKTKIN